MKKVVVTKEEFSQIQLKYVFGTTGDAGASRKYYNAQYQIHQEVHTKRKRVGDIYSGWKQPEVAWYVTYDPRVFDTAHDLWEQIFATPWFYLGQHKPVRKGYYQTDAGTLFWNGDSFNTHDVVTIWRGLQRVPFDQDAE